MNRKKLFFLIVYSLLMLWLLFGQRIGQGSEGILQLQPFGTVRRFLWVLTHSTDAALRRNAWVNLVGNVLLLIPQGFLYPWIWETWRKFRWHLLLMAAVIIFVELGQYILALGTCDVDDLLLNLFGTSLGYLLWKWLPKSERRT